MTARDLDLEVVADIHEACELATLPDEELHATVHALVELAVRRALEQFGPLPELRSPAFLAADPLAQSAVLLVLGEAWLVSDPHELAERIVAERRNAASKDVHAADPKVWRDLASRRAELRMPLPEYRRNRGAA
jgi:hypothetical protein